MLETAGTVFRQIIIVDDEPGLRDMVGEYLAKHGFAVRTAESGKALDALLAELSADLVLLDVNLGAEDGFAIARRLRASVPDIAIIMLTAMGEVVDRVVGLELGADDYVTKPFDLRELRARIHSVLRRGESARTSPSIEVSPSGEIARQCVPFGAKRLDLAAHCLVDSDGNEEKLTAMEFDLLQAFARNPNRVLTREQLLDLAHQRGMDPFDRSIDIRVTRIRRKIEEQPDKPQIIKTVRGSGYIFLPPKTTGIST
jgi:two-component system phosphate regulon response regulator OmpR